MFWDNDQYSEEVIDDIDNPFPRMISDAEFVLYNFETGEIITDTSDIKYKDRPSNIYDCYEISGKDFVDIDKSIYQIIKTFNNKGYKTSYCCGGHFITEMNLVKIDDMFMKMGKDKMLNIWNYVNYYDPYISINVPTEDIEYWKLVTTNIVQSSVGLDLLKILISGNKCHPDLTYRVIRIGYYENLSDIGDHLTRELIEKYINMDPSKVDYEEIKKDIIEKCEIIREAHDLYIADGRKEFEELSRRLPKIS